MRNPYRQGIAAVWVAGLLILGVPQQVWATDSVSLPDLVYYHNDHLNSSSLMTNGDSGYEGDIVHKYVYKPYGDEQYKNNTSANPSHRYTGQMLDTDADLYYYGARYYDAKLARFIQPDSVFPVDPTSTSQALNRYSYCNNNPVIYTDPSGHIFGFDDAVIAAALMRARYGAA